MQTKTIAHIPQTTSGIATIFWTDGTTSYIESGYGMRVLASIVRDYETRTISFETNGLGLIESISPA